MDITNYDRIIDALLSIKIGFLPQEFQIHDIISKAFIYKKIAFKHEYKLSSASRIDFISGDIGIEVKKSTLREKSLIKQLEKYAQSEEISKIIVVSTKSVNIPSVINNKDIIVVNLAQNWSVSL